MSNIGKITCLCLVMFLLAAGQVFSLTTLDDLNEAVSGFSSQMAKAAQFNSAIGLNWSDAYIGQFLGIPPKFGVGLAFGFTNLSIGPINDLVKMMSDAPLPFDAGLPLPGYTLEGRIGGFVLPFDIGFKIGTLPESIPILEAITGAKLSYLLVGGDFRYALVDSKLLKFSIGLGFNHLNGGVSLPIGSSFGPLTTPGDYTLKMDKPEIGLLWNTNCLEFKLQASIPTAVFTPYAGLGLNYSWTRAGYAINAKPIMTDPDGNTVDSRQFLQELKEYDIKGVEIKDNSIESVLSDEAFNIRVYGGISLNMTVIRLDLTGMYDLFNSNWGMTVGIRFQTF